VGCTWPESIIKIVLAKGIYWSWRRQQIVFVQSEGNKCRDRELKIILRRQIVCPEDKKKYIYIDMEYEK
jgi:hypothetical protein